MRDRLRSTATGGLLAVALTAVITAPASAAADAQGPGPWWSSGPPSGGRPVLSGQAPLPCDQGAGSTAPFTIRPPEGQTPDNPASGAAVTAPLRLQPLNRDQITNMVQVVPARAPGNAAGGQQLVLCGEPGGGGLSPTVGLGPNAGSLEQLAQLLGVSTDRLREVLAQTMPPPGSTSQPVRLAAPEELFTRQAQALGVSVEQLREALRQNGGLMIRVSSPTR